MFPNLFVFSFDRRSTHITSVNFQRSLSMRRVIHRNRFHVQSRTLMVVFSRIKLKRGTRVYINSYTTTGLTEIQGADGHY